jgi:DNA-binding LytR/AlgR family response regulator
MPKLTGMQVAQKLVKTMNMPPAIVFVTAYDQYAIEAFENHAIDYILKPVQDERLSKCCDKLMQQLNQGSSGTNIDGLLSKLAGLQLVEQKNYVTWLKASIRDEIHLISVAKIAFVKAEDKYLTVVCESETGNFREYTIRGALRELIEQLDPDNFWQIHRSTVIHLPYVDKVKKDITGKVNVYIANKKLPVSRSLQHLFK